MRKMELKNKIQQMYSINKLEIKETRGKTHIKETLKFHKKITSKISNKIFLEFQSK